MSIIDYAAAETYTKTLDVPDIGNFGIRCMNDKLETWYMAAFTVMGQTSIFRYGPVLEGLDGQMLDGFSFSYKSIDYKEDRIEKEIDFMLNESKKTITSAEVLPSPFKAFEDFPDMAKVLTGILSI